MQKIRRIKIKTSTHSENGWNASLAVKTIQAYSLWKSKRPNKRSFYNAYNMY